METRKPFAFISYSRKDAIIATDIRTRLEKYVYSPKMVDEKYRPDDDKYVRPIYQDLTDLHSRKPDFWEDLKEKVRDARYLIVICSPNSAKSKAVTEGITYFLETHNNNIDLIIPVFIDDITPMSDVINSIVKVRNCPVYITSRDKEGHMGRKYCFYHVLEYLLHVDFYKLYNRYEVYKKKKRARKMFIAAIFAAIVLAASVYGWITSARMAEIERQRAVTAEALTKFERKTFPYSLVVGYVNNFLRPALNAMNNDGENKAHFIIYMPYSYEQLNIKNNSEKLNNVIMGYPGFEGFDSEEIEIKDRKRGISIVCAKFNNMNTPVYIDQANTVVAFQYVVDYKFNSDENPIKVDDTVENRDKMVREYTDEFIIHTLKDLGNYSQQVHFVKSSTDLKTLIDKLVKGN